MQVDELRHIWARKDPSQQGPGILAREVPFLICSSQPTHSSVVKGRGGDINPPNSCQGPGKPLPSPEKHSA